MPQHLDSQERLAKLEKLLRSISRTFEDREMKVTCKGRVKDIGGIEGVDIDYSFSVKNLTDDSCTASRDMLRDRCKHPNA